MRCVCMRARNPKKAGRVKCMRTGKTEWARERNEKRVVKGIPKTPCRVYSLGGAHNLLT